MKVIGPRHVADPRLQREFAKLFAVPVVEDVNMQLLRRPVDIQRSQRRVPHYTERLVVSRNQQIDLRPVLRIVRQRHRRAPQRPHRLQKAQIQNGKRIGLCAQQQKNEKHIRPVPLAPRILEKNHNRAHPPPRVAKRREHRQHHQRQRDQIRIRNPAQPHANQQNQQPQHRLLRPRQGKRPKEDHRNHAEGDQNQSHQPKNRPSLRLNDIPHFRLGHRSLQRAPRCPPPAATAMLRIHVTRPSMSSAAGEFGA